MFKSESTIRRSIVSWSNTFPLDKWWRNRYKIPYGSELHRKQSQIDIYLEWQEEILFQQREVDFALAKEKAKAYKKGIWIESSTTQEEDDSLFDDIKI